MVPIVPRAGAKHAQDPANTCKSDPAETQSRDCATLSIECLGVRVNWRLFWQCLADSRTIDRTSAWAPTKTSPQEDGRGHARDRDAPGRACVLVATR